MQTQDIDLSDARILVVDDVPANLDLMVKALEADGYKIAVAPSGEVALRVVQGARPELILLDIVMPGMDGYAVCRHLKAEASTRDIPVIFITAQGETEGVVDGFQAGGVDYIVKPFHEDELRVRVQTHLKLARLAQELERKNAALEKHAHDLSAANKALEAEAARRLALAGERDHLAEQLSMISQREAEHWGIAGFVGTSRTLQQILREVDLLQNAETTSVLISGESGTGKELIARAIHYGSSRSKGPFVPLNCSTLPAELAESLLFGHVKGSFTGAGQDQEGHFGLAHKGTLFLDEIGDMPLEQQAKLLRVLEDGQIRPLGAAENRSVEVRILAASNTDLQERMAAGRFRQDLYYRLARFTVQVPPLRQRKEDIPLLARHFVELLAREMGRPAPGLSPEALHVLESYDFPGNVRELKNVIERALLESAGALIQPEHLHLFQTPLAETEAGKELEWPDFERDELEQIRQALEQTKGNITAAARLLGVNRSRIYRLMGKYQLGAGA
jgi:DNA-binding NtrC family response regulator